jgi:hypothetical protein
MRVKLDLVLLSLVFTLAGCSSNTSQPSTNSSQLAAPGSSPAVVSASPATQPVTAPAEASEVKPKLDACALLTSKEIESVQGEAIKETKLSGQATGGFSISQCFYTLPTFTNSVSLLVAQRGEGAGSHDPKEFWRDTFHENKAGEKDKDREREKERDKKRGEQEEEGAPPLKVAGVGDEAYWTGSRVGGALYVLKGNSYLRISIGGPAEQAAKISKSKALAQKAMARL